MAIEARCATIAPPDLDNHTLKHALSTHNFGYIIRTATCSGRRHVGLALNNSHPPTLNQKDRMAKSTSVSDNGNGQNVHRSQQRQGKHGSKGIVTVKEKEKGKRREEGGSKVVDGEGKRKRIAAR